MKVSRLENPEIDVYSIPGICQPAAKSPGIDFSGNRSLDVPAVRQNTILQSSSFQFCYAPLRMKSSV